MILIAFFSFKKTYICAPNYKKMGLMDKIQAKKLHKPLFYLPLQAFEKMNKKSAFTVVVK